MWFDNEFLKETAFRDGFLSLILSAIMFQNLKLHISLFPSKGLWFHSQRCNKTFDESFGSYLFTLFSAKNSIPSRVAHFLLEVWRTQQKIPFLCTKIEWCIGYFDTNLASPERSQSRSESRWTCSHRRIYIGECLIIYNYIMFLEIIMYWIICNSCSYLESGILECDWTNLIQLLYLLTFLYLLVPMQIYLSLYSIR